MVWGPEDAGRALRALSLECLRRCDQDPNAALAMMARECLIRFRWTEVRGNNRGPFIDAVMRDKAGLPWCAGFALHLAALVGLELPGGFWRNRSSSTLWANASRAGLTMQAGVLPAPGDIRVQYGRGMSDNPRAGLVRRIGHVGIVEKTSPTLGAAHTHTVHTIDGNWSNDLMARQIPHGAKSTTGYVRLRAA